MCICSSHIGREGGKEGTGEPHNSFQSSPPKYEVSCGYNSVWTSHSQDQHQGRRQILRNNTIIYPPPRTQGHGRQRSAGGTQSHASYGVTFSGACANTRAGGARSGAPRRKTAELRAEAPAVQQGGRRLERSRERSLEDQVHRPPSCNCLQTRTRACRPQTPATRGPPGAAARSSSEPECRAVANPAGSSEPPRGMASGAALGRPAPRQLRERGVSPEKCPDAPKIVTAPERR